MKKQGFTLIELMVVIVIMGILAAVAVPKLFGLIAKSKASEVGPAAGTYVKLQDAFFTEINKYGGWGKIGYTPAGKGSSTSYKATTFTYTSAMNWSDETNAGQTEAFKAVNTETALNDCKKGDGVWQINNVAASTVTKYEIPTGTLKSDCEILTPSFKNIVTK